MQIKQRVHLFMKLCNQEGIRKTQLYTDSLSLKINPRIITCKISHESFVARPPVNKLARAHANYGCILMDAHDYLE